MQSLVSALSVFSAFSYSVSCFDPGSKQEMEKRERLFLAGKYHPDAAAASADTETESGSAGTESVTGGSKKRKGALE